MQNKLQLIDEHAEKQYWNASFRKKSIRAGVTVGAITG
jgi:hypothetical protein